MTQHPNDNRFMDAAIKLAANSVSAGGGPFGAVVVRNGEIVGTGHNRVVLDNDPSAHAEVVAIRDACSRLGTFQLGDCTLYASCEPCPMCLATIYWARIPRVVYAADRHDAADAQFDDALIYHEVALPPDARQAEFVQVRVDNALAPFRLWDEHEHRTPY